MTATTEIDLTSRRFGVGLVFGLMVLGTSTFTRAWMLQNVGVNFLAQLVGPVAVFYFFKRDLLDTLTLLTISDICLNGVSTFLENFNLPGARSYAFLATLALTVVLYLARRGSVRPVGGGRLPRTGRLILFYGIIFPCILVSYSVLIRGTAPARAIWDVAFIAPILLYWPILRLLHRDKGFFIGYLIAMSVVLSLLALCVSLSPVGVSTRIVKNLGEDEDVFVTGVNLARYVGYTTTQGALPTFIITYIGFYFGLLHFADFTKNFRTRLSAALLAVLCFGHIFLDYIRGPVLGALGVCLLIIGIMAFRASTRGAALRISVFLIGLAAAFISIMSVINPVGLMRYSKNIDTPTEYIGGAREEIGEVMLAAFRERPLMGHGVGMPPTGYLRYGGEGPLNFELQYHLVLYRVGLIGFTIFIAPLAWFYLQLILPSSALVGEAIFTIQGQIRLALLLSVLTITIAGAVNPYLKTGYNILIITCYLAFTNHLHEQHFFERFKNSR